MTIFRLGSICSNSCAIHVSENAGKTGETLQWSAWCYELWGHLIITTIKEIKSSSRAWKEAWGCERTKPCGTDRATQRGKDPPRSTPSQFFQESVSMRQLRGEAFISLMHCITAGPLEKAPSLRGWMKKIRIWIPTPLNRLGSCEQPHISSRHVALWSLASGCRHHHQPRQQECGIWRCTERPKPPVSGPSDVFLWGLFPSSLMICK